MRLIDADKIKQSVTNEMLKAELNSPVYRTLECVIADIDNQPTAYDVDKVVEHLEKRKKYILTDFILANKAYEVKERTMARINEIDGLIKIVKSGGIE